MQKFGKMTNSKFLNQNKSFLLWNSKRPKHISVSNSFPFYAILTSQYKT